MGSTGCFRSHWRFLVPPLTNDLYKGSCGKVAVIGGSLEYTGAPYFAAVSALNTGCDLSHVFSSKEACLPIKSYSPELIVHPTFPDLHYLCNGATERLLETKMKGGDYDQEYHSALLGMYREKSAAQLKEWLPRMSCVVIGPGLGRSGFILDSLKHTFTLVRSLDLPCVVDADGLYFVSQNIESVRGYHKFILTPNIMEFNRIASACGLEGETVTGWDRDIGVQGEKVAFVAKKLGVNVLLKGPCDILSTSTGSVHQFGEGIGSPRRCGGQGDVLAGCLGTFFGWGGLYCKRNGPPGTRDNGFENWDAVVVAATSAASILTRTCSENAFKKHGRRMMAHNLIEALGSSFDSLFTE